MHSWLADLLIDPQGGGPLRLECTRPAPPMGAGAEVLEGCLVGEAEVEYPVHKGIPRFVGARGPVDQIAQSFGYKWAQRSAYEQPGFAAWYGAWLIDKYGFGDEEGLTRHFKPFRRVLEVGCGSGLSAAVSLGGLGPDQLWVGLDLSDAIDIARERLGARPNTGFVQADALAMPFRPGTFDAVFSEGVLHHTPSTRAALGAAVALLAPGGEIMFYVYRLKAPVREFTDDLLRERLADLPLDEAWRAMGPITSLAKALAELKATVEVPEDIPLLGIRAGTHDVQRLIYWHLAKLFWSDELGFEGSQAVNFDWYHPRYAHRQTEEQVRAWCDELGLAIVHFHAQESGFTVRAVRG